MIQKAHRAIITHSSLFLTEALWAQSTSDGKSTRLYIQTSAHFNVISTFDSSPVLYRCELISLKARCYDTLDITYFIS